MVLVAGATGLVGSDVCQRLTRQGEAVRALVRTTTSTQKTDTLRSSGVELCVLKQVLAHNVSVNTNLLFLISRMARLSQHRLPGFLARVPRLAYGSSSEREKWRLITHGEGIHWPELGEDIKIRSVAGWSAANAPLKLNSHHCRSIGAADSGRIPGHSEAEPDLVSPNTSKPLDLTWSVLMEMRPDEARYRRVAPKGLLALFVDQTALLHPLCP